MNKIPEYGIWKNLKQRCVNKNNPDFSNYGGRGITVCERWTNSFYDFISDMDHRPTSKHSIDRIDTDGPYAPWNCRWATPEEQANNCRTNRLVKYLNREQSLALWCKELKIHYGKTLYRLNSGMSSEEAFTLTSVEPLKLTHDGLTLTVAEWSKLRGINLQTLRSRLTSGISIKDALCVPANGLPSKLGMDIAVLDPVGRKVSIINSAREAARELGLTNHKTIVRRVKDKDLTPLHGFVFAYNNKANTKLLMELLEKEGR